MEFVKDSYLLECGTYEDYLNLFLTAEDLKYLQDFRYAQMLVELGYRTANEILDRDQFQAKRDAVREFLHPTNRKTKLFSEKLTIKDPVLQAMASRELPNHQKVFSTIIFISCPTRGGFDISGYIDFDESLRKSSPKERDWRSIFAGKKRLVPLSSDLSYHHWRSGITKYTPSDNYQIFNESRIGLMFMYRGDRKFLSVNPVRGKFSDAKRTAVFSPIYNYVIFYDHLIRRKI